MFTPIVFSKLKGQPNKHFVHSLTLCVGFPARACWRCIPPRGDKTDVRFTGRKPQSAISRSFASRPSQQEKVLRHFHTTNLARPLPLGKTFPCINGITTAIGSASVTWRDKKVFVCRPVLAVLACSW